MFMVGFMDAKDKVRFWFLHGALCAWGGTIVSGAMAERMQLKDRFVYVLVLSNSGRAYEVRPACSPPGSPSPSSSAPGPRLRHVRRVVLGTRGLVARGGAGVAPLQPSFAVVPARSGSGYYLNRILSAAARVVYAPAQVAGPAPCASVRGVFLCVCMCSCRMAGRSCVGLRAALRARCSRASPFCGSAQRAAPG